jgi:hypothetical protein
MTNTPVPGTGPMLPGDVSDIDRISATPPIRTGEEKVTTGAPFSSFMQEAKGMPTTESSGKSSMVSPFDLSKGQSLATSAPTLDTLLNQVKNAHETLGDLSTNMNTPGLKLKPSQKYLLKNKMSDANENMRVANAKLGAEIPGEPDPTKFQGPLAKFLSLLADGQGQMAAAQQQLENLKSKGMNMQPADFLMIQIKMNKAQQQLEYSSVLLSNAVSSLKQLMQVQL